MKRSVFLSGIGLAVLAMPAVVQAQGIVRGAEQGATVGSRVAGPVGGAVGGAIGSVAGGGGIARTIRSGLHALNVGSRTHSLGSGWEARGNVCWLRANGDWRQWPPRRSY
jgi:hypothetical protein